MTRAVIFVMLFGATLTAQQVIPAGTILPVELNTSLHSDKMHSGDVVKGRIMQDVPLPGHSKIRAGTKVVGVVDEVTTRPTPELAFRFHSLVTSKENIPVTTNLRALAGPMDVEQAKIPTTGPDRGTSEADWVTEQIGGETVYHGSVVTHGNRVVGNYVADGVLAQVSPRADHGCRGEVDGNDRPQALWVFSSDACGLYDLPDLELANAGRTDPVGEIRIRSVKGPVKIPSGSGMLLRVQHSGN